MHNPVKQASYLLQALDERTRPRGILIGAGCPTALRIKQPDGSDEPLIPDIQGLTDRINKAMRAGRLAVAFERICENLREDGVPKANVEKVLSYIRALRQIVGVGEARGMSCIELEELEAAISETIVAIVSQDLPNEVTPYHKLAGWLGASQREEPIHIFTTNYDLLLEEAMESQRIPYFDGFVGSHRTFFDIHAIEEDPIPPRWALLWKIHGSINWWQHVDGSLCRGECKDENKSSIRYLIHPSHLKYEESRKMPYLAMMDRLRAFLRRSSPVLVTCGYSFNDEHINESIIQGLAGNANAIVFALLFGQLQSYDQAIGLASTRTNLNLLAEDEAIINLRRGPWTLDADQANPMSSFVIDNAGQVTLSLGDFASLGDFLTEYLGSLPQTGIRDYA